MNLSLQHKTALVSGSTQGIGKAAARELAALGATVVCIARNEEKLQAVVAELNQLGGQGHGYLVADFSKPMQVQEAVQGWIAAGNEAHILVNNTGGPPAGPAHTATLDQFQDAFSQHLLCNHILMQAVVPGMQKAGYGRIVNVISTSVKAPLKNLGVSNTIRGAVANWSKTLATELAPFGITVNNVLPGATETERLETIIQNKSQKTGVSTHEATREMLEEIPAGRFAKPEEIGSAIAFLCSPAAASICGINLPVDGGRTPSL